MDIFPAIDLYGGKAVRLYKGDYSRMTVYSSSPADVAADFKKAGAEYLHLVDLDGAKQGKVLNFDLIGEIISGCGLKTEVGGGIRSISTAEHFLNLGAMRVIIGTSAATDPAFLKKAMDLFGDRIAVAVDMRNGFVATHGWLKTSSESGEDLCQKLQDAGVKTVICTDISRDGAMQGIDVEFYRNLARRFSMDIIASGGIGSVNELILLSEAGIRGAVLGKAIYSGNLDLKTAIGALKKAESV